MSSPFQQLTAMHLGSLADALEDGRLQPPFGLAAVGHYVPKTQREAIAATLQERHDAGASPRHLAYTLRLLSEAKQTRQQLDDRLELVWTGPDRVGATSRDTAVVVRELFRQAERSVTISSYSLDKAENMKALFGDLADKMDAFPDLDVTMFINIQRDLRKDPETPEEALLTRFGHYFREQLWPGLRLPAVYYDPRALAPGWDQRACLHAKSVVIDDRWLLVTSANFSEAAHKRNIEAGLLLDDERRARELKRQFEVLVDAGILVQLALPQARQHDPDTCTDSDHHPTAEAGKR